MNRLKISMTILAILVVTSVTALFIQYSQCEGFSQQAEIVMDSVEAGDTARALTECGVLLEQWEKFHDMTGLFVDGDRLDAVREILAGLPALIAAEHPEVLSRLEALQSLAEDIFREEIPDVWHIL